MHPRARVRMVGHMSAKVRYLTQLRSAGPSPDGGDRRDMAAAVLGTLAMVLLVGSVVAVPELALPLVLNLVPLGVAALLFGALFGLFLDRAYRRLCRWAMWVAAFVLVLVAPFAAQFVGLTRLFATFYLPALMTLFAALKLFARPARLHRVPTPSGKSSR